MAFPIFSRPSRQAALHSMLLCALLVGGAPLAAQAADTAVAPATASTASPTATSNATPAASTTSPAAAQNSSSATPPATSSTLLSPESGGGLLRSVMGLAIVLSLIGGLAWLARRFGNKMGSGKSSLLKTVAALGVGQRENVVVIELGDQWLVLGVAPGRVNTLAQLPRQELPQADLNAGAKAFASLLARARREDKQ